MSEFSNNFMKYCSENSSTFVETGTFKGVTTKLAADCFEKVVTIEIDQENFNYSKNKLKDINSIEFLFGDTIEVLPTALEKLKDTKATFWLDAHPMDPNQNGECPILAELDMIKNISNRKDNIIIIDDLQRCYNSIGDYPSFEEIKDRLLLINPDYIIKTLPFKAWQVKKGQDSVISASVENINFENSFYINKGSSLNKYVNKVKSIFGA